MRLRIESKLDYDLPQPADVLLALEVAQMPDQLLIEDKLTITSPTALTPIAGQDGIGRRTWVHGEKRFVARYTATVDVQREAVDLTKLKAVPLRQLPGPVIQYLWPSRYCQPGKLKRFASDAFGGLEGGARIVAIAEWTRANLDYVPGCSNEATTAEDSFLERRGICRDFAHVMICFARALDIPARMVGAYAWKLDPPDFHAVVEVYLDGGWYLVDPTGLAPIEGLVRIGVGRDAADVSFMTIFGSANLIAQSVAVERIG
jgi:transglutaminase-like putative cysteine protease